MHCEQGPGFGWGKNIVLGVKFRMMFPSKETVERLRHQFPAGCRIVLDELNDPYRTIPSGTQGTVIAVDDAGTIHTAFDNDGSLGITYGADRAHRVATEDEARVTLDYIGQRQHKDGFCPRCGAHMPGDPIRYALSRRANIMICSRCGQTEALEDAGMREKLPLMQWKAMREIQEGKAWRG